MSKKLSCARDGHNVGFKGGLQTSMMAFRTEGDIVFGVEEERDREDEFILRVFRILKTDCQLHTSLYFGGFDKGIYVIQ